MPYQRSIDRTRSKRRIRLLIGFSAIIMLLFTTMVVYQSRQAYLQALKSGEDDARRLTRILSEHVELTFLGADLALRRAIERQYMNSMFGGTIPQYMEQNFRMWLNETPQIAAMALVDARGTVAAAAQKPGYERWLDYLKSAQGAKLFGYMRDTDDGVVFVGRQSTKDSPPLILMSRRYSLLNGEFGGIVLTAIDPEYFIHFYQAAAFGTVKFMALTLGDGTALAEGPASSGATDAVVRRLAMERRSALPAEMVEGTYTHTYTTAEGLHIAAGRLLQNMPVLVTVILSEHDVLTGWRQFRARDAGFLVLFLVFGSALSFFAIAMARQIARAERSEETAILASQAKSEFLANMSHELRTPLNAIIGFSEMMNSGYFGSISARQKERIHDINLCGTHLLQLINDILEFSKGDAGRLELAEEPVHIADIVHETERMMSGKLKLKHIRFTAATEPDLPALKSDRRKIRQILLNLISNAIKFTPEQGSIRVIAMLDAQGCINLVVSDTGIGIPEQDIPKALSVFGQVHRSRSHEGTGLGLPLCKMYAELHGGKLAISSKVNAGTTVRIIFPRERTLTDQ